jgi:hypothetical protein
MGIATEIKETSGKTAAVNDSIRCINKPVLLSGINGIDHIIGEILSSLDGQILGN